MKLLAEEPVRTGTFIAHGFSGRRLRVLAQLVRMQNYVKPGEGYVLLGGPHPIAGLAEPPTYATALKLIGDDARCRDWAEALPLRSSGSGRPEQVRSAEQFVADGRDWELPPCLHDLAMEIREDLRAACVALSDPDVWYPGVDLGIPPVPDEHVRLVIAAMQRELSRETRPPTLPRRSWPPLTANGNLPAVPLADLPWRVQRALVERRRLRFAEYGIGQAEWERGTWSLWNVRDDHDWAPRAA